jgi:hypothetical protein
VAARPAERYRVSRVDHYVDCPFKYFAENVLGLPEERDEMAGLTPLERGNLITSCSNGFYRAWDEERAAASRRDVAGGRCSDSPRSPTSMLARLPEADRVLERARPARLAGRARRCRRGLPDGSRRGGQVVRRLLEIELKDHSSFRCSAGSRHAPLRSAARPIASTCFTMAAFGWWTTS